MTLAPPKPRQYSTADRLILGLQQLARIIPEQASNALADPMLDNLLPTDYPGNNQLDNPLTAADQQLSANLMRVNHAGEVAAQGLYVGQTACARSKDTGDFLRAAGKQERDHLQWCQQRLTELHSRPSLLSPFWHGGSVVIGVLNGLRGDSWSLGFVAETERQVEAHLQQHLTRLPQADHQSRAIIEAMLKDEAGHRVNAESAGAKPLPWPVRAAMKLSARVMTVTAFRF